MSAADVALYVGQLFGVWVMGWGSGYVVYTVKRTLDFI